MYLLIKKIYLQNKRTNILKKGYVLDSLYEEDVGHIWAETKTAAIKQLGLKRLIFKGRHTVYYLPQERYVRDLNILKREETYDIYTAISTSPDILVYTLTKSLEIKEPTALE